MRLIHTTTLTALLFTVGATVTTPVCSIAAETKAPERAIVTKAKNIVLPEFKLEAVTLLEAIKRLTTVAQQNDPAKEGVNFMAPDALVAADARITLDLKKVTLAEAIERLAKAANLSVEARDYAFVFGPKLDK